MSDGIARVVLEAATRIREAATGAASILGSRIRRGIADSLSCAAASHRETEAVAREKIPSVQLLAPTMGQRWEALRLVAESGLPLTRMVSLSGDLDWRTPVDLHLALENFSPDTGSIKDRAARLLHHQVAGLAPGTRCVIASSGNHGIAYARSCQQSGTPLTVVVPRGTSQLKITKLEHYGATVLRHGETWDEAYDHAKQLVRETDSHLLDVDAPDSVAALGTVVHEMLTQHPDAHAIVLPGGGGTIMTGAQIVREFEQLSGRRYLVLGACPADSATLARSLQAGAPRTAEATTIAEAMKVETVPAHLFDQVRTGIDDIITVSDSDIARGVVLLSDAMGHPVEAAGAVGPMAILHNDGTVRGVFDDYDLRGKKVLTVVTGGNISHKAIDSYLHEHF